MPDDIARPDAGQHQETLTRDHVAAAAERLHPHVRRTPVLDAEPALAGLEGGPPVSLKLEFLQHAGSFKARGAFNAMLEGEVPGAGVAAASGGNHGIAVAHAARALGHAAHIFVPVISSPAKTAAIRARGAALEVGGERYADALAACLDFVERSGAMPVHAYDAWTTMAGQGTVATEWEAQAPDLDTVLVAVGGGGLISGMAAWYDKRVRVVGVEPVGSQCLAQALAAGHPVDVTVESVAADSLGARSCGSRVFEVASRLVDRVVTVEDAAIVEAQARLWRGLRLAIEPGGAAALAALTSGAYRPEPGERVGVLLCGANLVLDTLAA